MRDLMRLVIVAIMSFAVVCIAMVYSRGGDLNTAVRFVTDGVSGAVADVGREIAGEPEAATPPAPLRYDISVARPNGSSWIGLAGFPDQTEISFPLPRGGHYLEGELDLDFVTQLTTHGDGLMTLAVNGTAREQVVLESGIANHKVRIALSPTDMAHDRVVLQMSARGTTGGGQICPTDARNAGAAVTLSASSSMELSSDRPLEDAVGALLMAPQPFVLSPSAEPGNNAFSIWANQRLNRGGINARFGAAGTGETAVTAAQHVISSASIAARNVLVGPAAVGQLIAAAGSEAAIPDAWPIPVASLGAETTVKTFRGSRRWTIPFNAADLPEGKLPEQLDLKLKASPLARGSDWVVRVTLNGNLIDAQRFNGFSDDIEVIVALPQERMLPSNALMVELVDTTPNEGECARVPEAQAQLLPESQLIDAGAATSEWAQLIETLAGKADFSLIAGDGLTPAQASRASELVALLVARNASLSFTSTEGAQLIIAHRGSLAAQMAGIPANTPIKAILPMTTASGLALTVLAVPGAEFGRALERLGPDDVVLLATGL